MLGEPRWLWDLARAAGVLAAAGAAGAQDVAPVSVSAVAESGAFDAGRASSLRSAPSGRNADLRSDPGRLGPRLPVDEAAVARALAALGTAFRRTETEHFVVLSDCPIPWTRTRESLLERARHQFFRAADRLELGPAPHAHKLVCVLINDHEDFRRFAREHDGLDAGWVAGYYAAASNRIVFYNDAVAPAYASVWDELAKYESQAGEARRRAEEARSRGEEQMAERLASAADDLVARINSERRRLSAEARDFSTAKTIHEAVHLLAFNTGVQRPDVDYPFWLTEGFASSFETDDPERAFGPDRDGPALRRSRYRTLAAAGEAPALGDLVGITRLATLDADAADAIYATGATLFAYLARHERAALALYIRALAAESAGAQRLGPSRHRELFTRYFGEPVSVERRMLAEVR